MATAEEKAAIDKAAADAAAAAASARAAAEKTKEVETPLVIAGVPGGSFTIRGEGFGTSGTLKIGGVQVQTTAWGDNRIKGQLPLDVSGKVEIFTAPDVAPIVGELKAAGKPTPAAVAALKATTL